MHPLKNHRFVLRGDALVASDPYRGDAAIASAGNEGWRPPRPPAAATRHPQAITTFPAVPPAVTRARE